MVKERQDITGLNCIKGASGKVIVDCVRAGATPFCYWSTHGSDDSLAGYQATAATTEELTADCCDRQQ